MPSYANTLLKGIYNFDYKEYSKDYVPLKGTRDRLIKGTWVAISTASEITGYSTLSIKYLVFTKKIKGMKFEKGSLLVNLRELEKLIMSHNMYLYRRKRRTKIT